MSSFFGNVYFKLGLILGLFVVSLLIVLPKTPIKIKNEYVSIDTSIGGYYLTSSDGARVLDLRGFKKGFDIDGGLNIVLKADMSEVSAEERLGVLETTREVIENRIIMLGVRNANVTAEILNDEYLISINLPRLESESRVIEVISQTARINFMELKDGFDWDESKREEYYSNKQVWQVTDVNGADIKSAEVVFLDESGNEPGVQIVFTDEGQNEFEELAKNNIGLPVAVFFDNSDFPIFMPIVSEEFAEGSVVNPTISGDFNLETASSLSIQINSGALPVSISLVEQNNVDAPFEVLQGKNLFYIGFSIISLLSAILIFLYGRLGLTAIISFILYETMLLSFFKLLPIVVTVPSLVGYLLASIIALYFLILFSEIYKQEIKGNKPKNLAVISGFLRSWKPTRDSILLILVISGFLMYIGIDYVQGFATALFLGMLLSLIFTLFISKTLIKVMGIKKDSQNSKFKRLFFWRKYASS